MTIDYNDIRARIAEVRKHDATATPAPWYVDRTGLADPFVATVAATETYVCSDPEMFNYDGEHPNQDDEAIAAFRSLAPQLAEDVDGLLEENERLQQRFDDAMAEAEKAKSVAWAEVDRLKAKIASKRKPGGINKWSAYICEPCANNEHYGLWAVGACQCSCDGKHDSKGNFIG